MKLHIALIASFVLVAMTAQADDLSLEAFDAEVEELQVDDPTDRDPLAMNATLVSVNPGVGDPVIAVLKLKMSPGWYIYEEVPATQPFIETDWILNANPALEIVDVWAGPPSTRHKDISSIRVHEAGPAGTTFFRELEVIESDDSTATVEVGLRYQICNPEYCLPPTTKTKELSVALADD